MPQYMIIFTVPASRRLPTVREKKAGEFMLLASVESIFILEYEAHRPEGQVAVPR
jgi:hypothetical protein